MLARSLRVFATGRNVLIVLAIAMAVGASFGIFFTPAYERASGGAMPFDMQFPLTAQMIGVQLALLTPDSVAAYRRFLIADFVFPPANGLFLTLLWAWLLNCLRWARLDGIYDSGAWIMPFMPAAADLSENVLFYRIVAAAPSVLPEAIDTALTVHDAKLRLLSVVIALTVMLALTTAVVALRRRFGAR